ncbi:MAG: alpha/beta hydrolase [Cereibacter sphaeroides]|uniref:Alpha/beta hydrolase n=1 Tax=Cereibacter sphaeroides TaxID=1063 RepID=A0A2W5SGR4_CERSP|nr:MAG: alpha/beta hydrolase [Cereibacter sphaeroides]
MPDEINALRAIFSSKPRPVDWAERRARMDEVCSIDAPPSDVVFTPLTVAGCPAEWSETAVGSKDRAVLYLHGGGYCSGSLKSHRTIAGGIAKAAGLRALALAFRLAPENPYPAALEDALGAWNWLIAQGLAPENIAVAGDSAGGGLSLALMLRLREAGQPLPGAAWLISPWTDLTMSGASITEEDAVDPLIHGPYLRGLAEAYLAGHDPEDPLVSPLFARLQGLPPVLIQIGSDETLLDDSLRLARALGPAHVPVTLQVYPRMIHAFPIWAARLAEGRRALADAAGFLGDRLGG